MFEWQWENPERVRIIIDGHPVADVPVDEFEEAWAAFDTERASA